MMALCEGCSAPPDAAIWILYGVIWGPAILLPLGWIIAIGLFVHIMRRRVSK